MSEKRCKFDQDFKDGAFDVVLTSGRPVAEIARDLGINEGTLGNWVEKRRRRQTPGALREDERRAVAVAQGQRRVAYAARRPKKIGGAVGGRGDGTQAVIAAIVACRTELK